MLPLGTIGRDKIHRFKNATFALIIINILVFIWEIWASSKGEAYFTAQLASIAFNVCEVGVRPLPHMTLDALRSMFLHGSVLHIGGNMLFLWVFGRKVEEYLGAVPYVIFYLLAGYAATLGHLLLGGVVCETTGAFTGLIIGASGAVAGVMGAFLFLYPSIRIKTLIGIFPPLAWQAKLPAIFFLVYWFVMDFLKGIGWMESVGVAHWAHIGGFLFGFVVVFFSTMLFKPAPKPDPFAYLDE